MQAKTVSNKSFITFLILLTVTFSQAAIDIYLPSLPVMQIALRSSTSAMQLTLTSYLIGLAIAQLIWGPLSDRFGRLKILYSGLVIFLVATAVCALSPTAQSLIIARFFQGAGIGAANVLSRAMVRDVFSGDELVQKFSYVSIGWSITPLIAPVLGGYIGHYLGWRMNFVFLFIYVGASLYLFYKYLPETRLSLNPAATQVKAIIKNYFELFTSITFIGNLLCIILLFSVFIAFSAAAPFILENNLHLSQVEYGWVMLLTALAYLLGSVLNSRCSKKISPEKAVILGLVGYMIFSLAMLITATLRIVTVVTILAPMFLIFLCIGFIYPNCMVLTLKPFPQIAGSASAIYGCLTILGGAIATAVVANVPINTQLSLSLMIVVEGVLMFLVFVFARNSGSSTRT